MKISSLTIENFKGITNINIQNIPNFVVLVGENGVGKTSIFEAIGFVKSMVGPYTRNDQDWWRSRIMQQPPIRIGADEMKIIVEIEPTTDQEKQLAQNKIARAGVILKRVSSPNPQTEIIAENNVQQLLQSWKKLEGIGGVELIPANRAFPEGQVTLQSKNPNPDDFYSRRTAQLQNKYHDAKQLFVNFAAHDALRPNEQKTFPDVKNLVETLLGKKVEINFDENLMPKIQIESGNGLVDIDTLSSGQRELFLTYVGIHSAKLSNSIILFDEPDLHLHASMQKEVIRYLMNLSSSGNQLFVATHALEMIIETPEQNLFHLSNHSESSQLKPLKDEKDKLELFKKLGASKYTFVNFKKIVFLEGPTDYLIFHQSTPSEYGLRFEQIGGISNLTPQILEEASSIESFFMIRDRDFLNDDEITSMKSKYKNKIKFLSRRHIENFILDSDELFEIYQKYGNGKFLTKDELINELFSISQNQLEQTIADYYIYKHGENTNPPRIHLKTNETAEEGLNSILQIKETRLKKSISDIPQDITSIRTDLSKNWNSKWLTYCSGKNVLRQFSEKEFSSKSLEDIRDLVSTKWDERKQLPKELDQILREIKDNVTK